MNGLTMGWNGRVKIVLITNVSLETLRLSLGPLPERRGNKVSVFYMVHC